MRAATATPATLELAGRVRRLIAAEELAVGERLGTERVLAEQLGVGRTLLRQALQVLEDEGRIVRRIGRHGGVEVSDGKVDRALDAIDSIPALLHRAGRVPRTVVLSASLVLAGPRESRALGVEPRDPLVDLLRLRLADDEPFSLEHARLPSRAFPDLLQQPLDTSLYRLLHTRYGCDPTTATESIEAGHPSSEEAAHLALAPTDVVLRVTRVSADATGRPIELSEDVFRADRVRLEATITGTRSVVVPTAASR